MEFRKQRLCYGQNSVSQNKAYQKQQYSYRVWKRGNVKLDWFRLLESRNTAIDHQVIQA